jgi:hypothetical protein
MDINTDKTKSLVFNSTGRLFPVTFKQFNFRELRVTGLQVWSKISGRSLINNLNRLGLRLSPWRTPMLEENESVTFDL